ncbi:MFS transporter prlL [Hyphodiscus hymeniophilus]|uniref:MFS transporter prlL n=1 Tax=Hyphodiscus hymeniophilus TaxID=353542 RepID=A0A9P7AXW8_9HELO|nr:MFS transporter prlL [Hyphodiscus hymeniophilus]
MASIAPNSDESGLQSESYREKNESATASSSTVNPQSQPFDEAATKRLLRKLDWHLIPFFALIYLLCFLDRTNVGNARLVKLEVDLGMRGLDYNVALAIFFPFYVIAEIPSNVMMKRIRPSIWLTFIMLAWGIIMTCMGLVHNFRGLLACRVFLGIAEGGLFPGVNYFITMWAKFLTMPERIEVERRLAADSKSLSNDFHVKYVGHALADWKIWVMSIIAIGVFTPLYSISLFLPTIIKELGYANNAAQLLTVPPYAVACLLTIAGSYLADKARQRGLFLLGFELVAIVGFVMLITNDIPHVQYAGTFFAAAGIFPAVPLIVAWNSNNIGGSLKRGVGIALQIGIGNSGGVIASFVYISKDQPRFIQGHAILIGTTSLSACLTILMTTYYRRENARRDSLAHEHGTANTELSDEVSPEMREMGDQATFFRYTV